MGTDRYRAIKGIGPWGATALGWRAMGSVRIWGHKRYRAMGSHNYGAMGAVRIWGPKMYRAMGSWGHSYGVEGYGVM